MNLEEELEEDDCEVELLLESEEELEEGLALSQSSLQLYAI